MYNFFIKPVIDKLVALIVIFLTFPLVILIIIVLLLFQNGYVFFVQERPGKDGEIFKLFKFQTMNNKKNKKGELLPDHLRLTRIGKFLRKLSFDELPQLINVLKGDMSLIGPRPWLVEYLPLYNDFQKRRHEVKPGITGWAQVNGRNNLDWDTRFDYDIYYVDNVSFKLDIKIIKMTILNVAMRIGVNQDGKATVDYFKGNK